MGLQAALPSSQVPLNLGPGYAQVQEWQRERAVVELIKEIK
jgi:hypothetical protein